MGVYPSQVGWGTYPGQIQTGIPRPGPDGGDTPARSDRGTLARSRWGGTPGRDGVPPGQVRMGGGVPVGMPLAFAQEDFLVYFLIYIFYIGYSHILDTVGVCFLSEESSSIIKRTI